MKVNKKQTNPPASQVTTHNRFAILETTEDAMDITEAVNTQHTQKTPPPLQIFIDDWHSNNDKDYRQRNQQGGI